MEKILEKYLKDIQTDESFFPMDSIHTGKELILYKDKESSESKKKIKDEE